MRAVVGLVWMNPTPWREDRLLHSELIAIASIGRFIMYSERYWEHQLTLLTRWLKLTWLDILTIAAVAIVSNLVCLSRL